jgi:hypothetical protein
VPALPARATAGGVLIMQQRRVTAAPPLTTS